MGHALTKRIPFAALLLLLPSGAVTDGMGTIAMIGLSGTGKTTIVGNLCGLELETGNSMGAVTMSSQVFECGNLNVIDTVGMMHLTRSEDGTLNGRDAYHDGLESLLTFLDGKEVGHIYVVFDSRYMRDRGRLISQIEFLQQVLNPLIPWTALVNCFHGTCIEGLDAEDTEELVFTKLRQLTSNVVEVVSPHLQPIDRSLFPAPPVNFKIDLPENWRSLIAEDKVSHLFEAIDQRARGQCEEFERLFLSTKEDLLGYQCSFPQCSKHACTAENDCPAPSCPPFSCHENCRVCKTKRFPLCLPRCKKTTCWDDQGCVDARNKCHRDREAACEAHNRARAECLQRSSRACEEATAQFNTCVATRDRNCHNEEEAFVAQHKAVIAQVESLYKQCEIKFGPKK